MTQQVQLYGFKGTVNEMQQAECNPNSPMKFMIEVEGAQINVEVAQKKLKSEPELTPQEVAFSIALDEFGLLEA